jgi:hypothetical protein
MRTLDENQIVDGLLETELLNQEGLLLLGGLFEEVFQVSIPDLAGLSIKGLSSRLHAHIDKYLAH